MADPSSRIFKFHDPTYVRPALRFHLGHTEQPPVLEGVLGSVQIPLGPSPRDFRELLSFPRARLPFRSLHRVQSCAEPEPRGDPHPTPFWLMAKQRVLWGEETHLLVLGFFLFRLQSASMFLKKCICTCMCLSLTSHVFSKLPPWHTWTFRVTSPAIYFLIISGIFSFSISIVTFEMYTFIKQILIC